LDAPRSGAAAPSGAAKSETRQRAVAAGEAAAAQMGLLPVAEVECDPDKGTKRRDLLAGVMPRPGSATVEGTK